MNTLRLTRSQAREIDRIAIEEYGLPGIVLMENAARGAADIATAMTRPGDGVLIYCGTGNNGCDGFAIARHLMIRGRDVTLMIAESPERIRGDAAINFRVIERMGLTPVQAHTFIEQGASDKLLPDGEALLIDALFGTGLTRAVAGASAVLVEQMNASGLPILAVDIPSGLDCDTGEPLGPCVRATKTVTFAAEKIGFANPASRAFTGEVIVGDIGVPRDILARVTSPSPD
jgi:NAD(P)H-hydrate epimerase